MPVTCIKLNVLYFVYQFTEQTSNAINDEDTLWNSDNLNKTIEDWIFLKASLQDIIVKLKLKYSLDQRKDITSFFKLFMRVLFLLFVAITFISSYVKCRQFYSFENALSQDKYLSNFTKTMNDNETIRLRIPFCSIFYKDGYYLDRMKRTTRGKMYTNWLVCYLYIEFYALYVHRFTSLLKYVDNTLFSKNDSRLNILSAFVAFAVLLVIFVLILIVFILVYISLAIFLKAPNFVTIMNLSLSVKKLLIMWSKEVSVNLTMLSHIITLCIMYALKERLKLHGFFGRLVIKNSYSIKAILNVSILGAFLSRMMPLLIKTFSAYHLPAYILNCSTPKFNNSLAAKCFSYSFKVNISDLDYDVKSVFADEINNYIYENSIFMGVFPFLFGIYILFFVYILLQYICLKTKCKQSELELAEIEQHLVKYYSKHGNKRRKVDDWSICRFVNTIYESIFGHHEVEILMEIIKRKCELNVLERFPLTYSDQ